MHDHTHTTPEAARWSIGRITLIVLTLLAWFPVLAVLLALALAAGLGCAVDEGSVHACTVAGVDIGAWLYAGFMWGWALMLTLPFMLGTAVAWLVVLLQHRARRRRSQGVAR